MLRTVTASLVLLLLIACGDAPFDPGARRPGTDPRTPDPTPEPSVSRIVLYAGSSELDIVGASQSMTLVAYDAAGRAIDPAGVLVSSSDAAVAAVGPVTPSWRFSCDTNVGVCVKSWEASVVVHRVGVGIATITASLRGVGDSRSVRVRPIPTLPAALVIDSFRVVEYAPVCAWGCPYKAYVPLVWMRAPAGGSPEFLQAMNFTVPTHSTGWCLSGGAVFSPGDSRQINKTFDPYLWNNDFFLVDLRGPVPNGPATLQVLVSDEEGNLRIALATAPIERNGTPPLGDPSGGC